MPNMRARARAQLPQVLLTLLSIIQAVALERLWNVVVQRTDLFELTWQAGLGWLQTANTFFVIVVIWLVYLGLVMRFRWTPTIGDLTYPFLVGVVELLLIETIGLEHLGAWFITFGIVFAFLQWLAHNLYRRAREDPENIEFFETMGKATWYDQFKRATVSLVAVVIGIVLWSSDEHEWLSLIALLASSLLTLGHIWVSAKFWESSMLAGEEVAGADSSYAKAAANAK
ncbi:MAG: hypothetical protein AAF542_22160 [Pseudomonadota bacterium]